MSWNEPGDPLAAAGAIVVLGCRTIGDRPSRALQSRLKQALDLHKLMSNHYQQAVPLLVSGGRRWEGHSEAEVMKRWLGEQGIAEQQIVTETRSRTTYENAKFSAALLRERNVETVALVTSDFHVQRAQRLFEKQGLTVLPKPATTSLSLWARLKNRLREWGARCLELVLRPHKSGR